MPKPAAKPVIAIDIDDVISAQNENMRRYANRKYGHNHGPNDYLIKAPYWGYWGHIWKVTDEEQERRVQHYNDSGELSKQELVPGAIEALTRLNTKFKLVLVTSRYDKHAKETREWLEQHFEDLFHDIRFARIWNGGQRQSKASICREVGAGYLIDDNAEHCNLAAESGITSLLFGEYGWNRNVKLHEDVVKVKNWQEVLEYFNAKG